MFSVEPIVVVAVVCATVMFMRGMPRVFAWLIVRIADRLLVGRRADVVEALNGRQVPAIWTAGADDRKFLRGAMRSTMRVTTLRSLYLVSRWNSPLSPS